MVGKISLFHLIRNLLIEIDGFFPSFLRPLILLFPSSLDSSFLLGNCSCCTGKHREIETYTQTSNPSIANLIRNRPKLPSIYIYLINAFYLLPVTPQPSISFSPLASFEPNFGQGVLFKLRHRPSFLSCVQAVYPLELCFQTHSGTFAPGLPPRTSLVDYS